VADIPCFLGCQFHPKSKSKPLEPHPLFTAFLGAALGHREARQRLMEAREERVPAREYSHAE